ncbi:MAG: putative toxin-antitoxin system toxin component, PIN family [Myxococcaceae bacterium]|nr:putative toxin-antitoxin system toxin component, PIN family [Myxococcaceae bacterium]
MHTSRPSTPLSVVLDTNVVLDLLVFDDPLSRPLADALAAGALIPWADKETLLELERVLTLSTFKLEVPAQQAALARYRHHVQLAPEQSAASLPALPRCRDRDDQKFLVLAAHVGAAWLVSKDKRLLSLADWHGLPFAILSPKQAAQGLRLAPG